MKRFSLLLCAVLVAVAFFSVPQASEAGCYGARRRPVVRVLGAVVRGARVVLPPYGDREFFPRRYYRD